ncbi:MAG: ATP-binding protein, partial [Verrucomicrobiota bacterium]
KYAQEYLELAGIRHRFEVPAQLPAVDIAPEVRHNVFLAFKESVNNVVKHAQASAVSIRLRLDAGKFTLEIEDDGRGIDNAPKKTGRSGMGNLRKRMEDVGGIFAIGPAPAKKGTLVQLTAPFVKL